MKAFIGSALALLLLCNAAQAQHADAHPLLFLKNHFSAGFTFPVTLSKHEYHSGMGDFNMRTLPGFALEFDYTYNFNPYIGITSGTTSGLKNFGYSAKARPDEFPIARTVTKDYMLMLPFFSIPFTVTPRVLISEKHMLQADIGASITFFIPGGTINTLNHYTGKDLRRVFEMKLFYKDSPLFMLHAGISYGKILKNENILKLRCTLDYGKTRTVEGYYTFYGDDMKIGYGKMYSSLSSISVGLSYVFTRAASIQKS